MRPFSSLAATLALAASLTPTGCGSSTGQSIYNASGAPGGSARQDSGTALRGGTSHDGASGLDPGGPPTQLSTGPSSISGVTSDGWAVFRAADVLRAVKIAADAVTQDITDSPGNVLIRGKVVFNWANVDWTANVGDLSVWTADAGTHHIGPTMYS